MASRTISDNADILQASTKKHNPKKNTTKARGLSHQSITASLTEETHTHTCVCVLICDEERKYNHGFSIFVSFSLVVGIIPISFTKYINLRTGFENAQHVVLFVIWIR